MGIDELSPIDPIGVSRVGSIAFNGVSTSFQNGFVMSKITKPSRKERDLIASAPDAKPAAKAPRKAVASTQITLTLTARQSTFWIGCTSLAAAISDSGGPLDFPAALCYPQLR
jgi:hypothetical protein